MCSFEQLLLLLSVFCLASAQTDECGGVDFDVGPLISKPNWTMTIPEQDCEFFPSSSCTLYMAFCQPLPSVSTLCNNKTLEPGSTGVCVTDGTGGYSLGEENDNPFVEISGKLTAQFLNGSDGQCSDDTIQTEIVFNCNPLANWGSLIDNDASDFFGSIFVDYEDSCKVTINVHYDGVCQPEVCEAGDHDINPLIGPDHWEADVDHEQCNEFFGKYEKCTLYLSFCKNMMNVPGCYNSTVCLSNGTVYYKLGQYSRYINPFALSVQNTLNVMYLFGKSYSKCLETNSNSDVILHCSAGQDWNYNGSTGNATDRLLVIGPVPLAPCKVLITMNYTGACGSAAPTGGSSSDEGTDVGWVGLGLLLGLIVIVTLYLTIGSAINIAKGQSGCPEMLPQYAFWKAFFIYVVEGVYFTADLFTCGWCSRTAGPAPSSNYDKL